MGTFIQLALIAGAAAMLAACGVADSHSPVPDFMRAKAAEPPPPEVSPNVKDVVRDHLESVFVSTSSPRDVKVTPPLKNPHGPGWTACVRAEVISATGKPVGAQTYRIIIRDGEIIDRRRVDVGDNCASESYQPV